MSMRIGFGFDSHAFQTGVPLVIGGLPIDHPEGLAGHSDGDVLLHAITDALLGAVSAGDIGTFFPPSDPRWKGAASSLFLRTAMEEIQSAGYRIVNLDTCLVMTKPKIVPIANELRESVAELLQIKPHQVGIKAKTPEGLNQDGVAVAYATVLLESIDLDVDDKKIAAVVDVDEVNDVVESLVVGVRDTSALGRKIPAFDTDDLT
jgi:2-C-methyl-D-erythritol 2,4-cyclodiphosphate synthase